MTVRERVSSTGQSQITSPDSVCSSPRWERSPSAVSTADQSFSFLSFKRREGWMEGYRGEREKEGRKGERGRERGGIERRS